MLIDWFGNVSPEAGNNKEKKKINKTICLYNEYFAAFALMALTSTNLFMESLTVMGVRLVLDKMKEGFS